MAARFQYKQRAETEWEKRKNQSGGSYIGIFKDQFLTFSHKKGDNWIRILPPTWDDARHYGYDVWVHYSVGPQNGTVICLLKMKNKPCPICEDCAIADKRGDKAAVSNLKPYRRVVVWVIDRNEKDESKQTVLWAMPWSADKDISSICRDKQTGELYQIDNPDTGFDLNFERESEGQTTKYKAFVLARRATQVEDKYLDFITTNPIPSTLLWRSYEEVKELHVGVDPDADKAPQKESTPSQPGQQTSPEQTQTDDRICGVEMTFKGTKFACGLKPHADSTDHDFSIEIEVAKAEPAVEQNQNFCPKTITAKGKKWGCALATGHQGECDFDRDMTAPSNGAAVTSPVQSAQPTPAVQPQVTAASAVSSRASALRAKFEPPK